MRTSVLWLLMMAGCGDYVAGMDQCGMDPRAEPVYARLSGDQLQVSLRYEACADLSMQLCWVQSDFQTDGELPELEVGVRSLSPLGECTDEVLEDVTFDLSPVKRRFKQVYGEESGTLQLRIGEHVFDYEFDG